MQEKSLKSWIRDAACGSGAHLVKPGTAMEKKVRGLSSPRKGKEGGWKTPSPIKLFGQEYIPETWAMADMNMTIHDMGGQIETGDSFKNPRLREKAGKLRIVELKAIKTLAELEPAQALHCLKATGFEHALLNNSATPRLDSKRFIKLENHLRPSAPSAVHLQTGGTA